MADSRDASICPVGLWRCAGEGDQVHRERHFFDDPLDLLRIGEAGHEETAGAGVGERLTALDRFVDQCRIMGLRLEVQIGTGVDKELVTHGAADRCDTLRLQSERMQTLTADDLAGMRAAMTSRR